MKEQVLEQQPCPCARHDPAPKSRNSVAPPANPSFILAATGALGIGGALRASLPETGVDHPITAVLLELRSYNTLHKIAVLVVAIGVWQRRVERARGT